MKRMMKSYDLKNASSWLYYPAKNADIALANEAYFMSIYGGAQSMMKNYKLTVDMKTHQDYSIKLIVLD